MNLATIGWPSGTDTGWPSEPRNMLPGRVEGFPAGVQASANTAERLLSQAVAYWDASQYRDGDRFLRNRGTAGELLDLRLGSSITPNTNDPKFLDWDGENYVYLPGVVGNYLSVPDEAALDITGDIEIIWCGTLDDAAAGSQSLVSKWQVSGQFAYRVMASSGAIQYRWSADGVNITEKQAFHGVASGEKVWIKVRHDVDNGAGGNDVTFFKSSDGYTWVQFGTTQTTAGTTSIYSGTSRVEVGSLFNGAGLMAGRVYRAQVLNGIDGTPVLDVDCSQITSGSNTSFTALTGQTVTINRSTSGRKSVAVPSRANRGGAVFLFGTDDYMQVTDNWQHQLLNFGQGDSFTVLAVVRQWATQITGDSIVNKRNSGTYGTGWFLDNGGTNANGIRATIADGVDRAIPETTARSLGGLDVLSMRIDRSTQVIIVNDGQGTNSAATTTIGSLSNSLPMYVGRQAAVGSANYNDMEFVAAAVFRKALTAGEITTLSNYFAGRVA